MSCRLVTSTVLSLQGACPVLHLTCDVIRKNCHYVPQQLHGSDQTTTETVKLLCLR